MSRIMLVSLTALAVAGLTGGSTAVPAAAHDNDPTQARIVVEWNHALLDALTSAQVAPPPAMRAGAIVASSVFDAVNGITHRYAPYAITAAAPGGASPRAAAAAAAHRSLTALFPARRSELDALLVTTLAGLPARERRTGTIDRGLAWGVSVADTILALRAHDGFTATPAPYVISPAPGRWQPTPPTFTQAPAFRQFAGMTPWALTSPAQITSPAPPDLTSARYARDFAEVHARGAATSAERSAFDTQTAVFWQSTPPIVLWDPVADALIGRHHLDLGDAARLLAQVNIAMADTVIAVWNAKNAFDTWRPITAIHNAALDGNPRTGADPQWQPLLVTPTFQEYPAGHPAVSQAAAAILADRFGDRTGYTLTSPGQPGVTRTLRSFSAGVAQATDARILGGIHFRFACDAATAVGRKVAAYVETTQMRRRR
jgi:hypothetical protein